MPQFFGKSDASRPEGSDVTFDVVAAKDSTHDGVAMECVVGGGGGAGGAGGGAGDVCDKQPT